MSTSSALRDPATVLCVAVPAEHPGSRPGSAAQGSSSLAAAVHAGAPGPAPRGYQPPRTSTQGWLLHCQHCCSIMHWQPGPPNVLHSADRLRGCMHCPLHAMVQQLAPMLTCTTHCLYCCCCAGCCWCASVVPRCLPQGAASDAYDVVVLGGTLGILLATALLAQQQQQQPGAAPLRVAVVERGKLQGRQQEWNASHSDLQVRLQRGCPSLAADGVE